MDNLTTETQKIAPTSITIQVKHIGNSTTEIKLETKTYMMEAALVLAVEKILLMKSAIKNHSQCTMIVKIHGIQ